MQTASKSEEGVVADPQDIFHGKTLELSHD